MVGTLIATEVFGLVLADGFAFTATAFAVNFATSVVINRILGQQSPSQTDNGVRQQIPPNSANAIPVVYGNSYLGGTFVDAVLSTDQKTMYYVLAVSCISPNTNAVYTIDSSKLYYGNRLVTFKTTGNTNAVASLTDEAGNVDPAVADGDLLQIYLYKSSATGTITGINTTSMPSTVMGGTDIDSAYRWPSSGRQMNGLGFAIIKLQYNQSAQTTQLQPLTFYTQHYPNGGSYAKAGDVWYDYITNAQYGGAIDPAYVDTTSVTALNTYGDQLITYTPSTGGTATQKRYTINGVLNAGETVLNNIDKILMCCDSWMAYQSASGQWSIVINQAQSTAYAFDDNNIIGEIRVSATDITSSVNQIEAQFPNKENLDQTAFVNLATPSALLYPNEPVNKYSVTFSLSDNSVQTTYLANRILEQAREDLIVTFSTTYFGIQVDAGDVVSVTNADYGWTAKLFRVTKVMEVSLPNGLLGAQLEMTEYNANVYADGSITEFQPTPNSGLASPNYFSALSAPTITGHPSATIPNFDVTVTSPTTGRITTASFYYTTSATPSASDWQTLNTSTTATNTTFPNASTFTLTNQSLASGTYYFAFTVGNENGNSPLSPKSSAFVWNPVGMIGPTGPTGSGTTGPTGPIGLTTITAYKLVSQTGGTPATPSNTSGATIPSGWQGTVPAVSVGNVLWTSFGSYNENAFTYLGIPANTTVWSSPIATSIFQDIESDNWNNTYGPSPTGPWGPTGSAGYYIQKASGNMWLNSLYARGIAQFDGANTIALGNATAILANNTLTQQSAIYGRSNYSGQATAIFSNENSSDAFYSHAVTAETSSSNGFAVYALNYGTGSGVGVYGQATGTGSNGVIGAGNTGIYGFTNLSSGGVGGLFENVYGGTALKISTTGGGKFQYGATTIQPPPASNTYFLAGDGNWYLISSVGGGTVTSVSGTGTVSGLTLSGTVTTSGNLTLGGSLSLTSGQITSGLGYTPYDSSNPNGYITNSTSSLTNYSTTTTTLAYIAGYSSQFNANSGTAFANSSQINLYGSTSTGIAGAYIGTTGSGNTVTFGVQTTSPSDIRLKEEITDSDLGLEFVKQLRPVSYKLKADPIHQKGYGFIADEVEKLIPLGSSLVYEDANWKVGEETGFKTIHYPSYIAVLTKAIQEMNEKIIALEAKIDTMTK